MYMHCTNFESLERFTVCVHAWLRSCMRLIFNKAFATCFGWVGCHSGSSHWFFCSRQKPLLVREQWSYHLEMTVALSICEEDFNFCCLGLRIYFSAASRALSRKRFPICKSHIFTMPWNRSAKIYISQFIFETFVRDFCKCEMFWYSLFSRNQRKLNHAYGYIRIALFDRPPCRPDRFESGYWNKMNLTLLQ